MQRTFLGLRLALPPPATVAETFPVSCGTRPSGLATVCVLYLALTLLLTLPVALRMGSRLCGDVGDNYAFLWWLEWFSRAVTELHVSPVHSEQIHHPLGASFLLNPTTLANAIPAALLRRFLPIVPTYNLLVLASFWLSAVGMYLLALELTGSRRAAFLGGFLFAFCPYRFAHALGHLTTLSTQWLPFFLLYLVRSLRTPARKNVLAASLFLALNALSCWYFLVDCWLFAGFAAAYFSLPSSGKESGRLLRTVVAVLALGTAAVAPPIVALVLEKVREGYGAGHAPGQYPADALGFFVPPFTSSWGMLFYPVWSRFRANPVEGATFVGYSVLLLLLWAGRRIPRPAARFWGLALVFFFVCSLGPFLNVAGRALPIPLPYLAFDRLLPLFSLGGVPARLHIVTTACLAVLCAYAAREGFRRSRTGGEVRGLLRPIWICVGILLLLDHLHVPVFTAEHRISPFYVGLSRDREDYGLVDLTARGKALFCTTIHGKKLVGGYVARPSPRYERFIERQASLRAVFSGRLAGPPEGTGPRPDEACRELSSLDLRYLIYPKGPSLEPIEALLDEVHGETGGGGGRPSAVSETPAQEGPEADPRKVWAQKVSAILRTAGPLDTVRLAMGLRRTLAAHPELLPTDEPLEAIRNSERIVRDVWGFPLVYEDRDLRVYGVPRPCPGAFEPE